MSSLSVRQAVWDQMQANWVNTPWYDLSDYVSYEDIPSPETSPFVLLQFMGGTDQLVTIGGTEGNQGYREDGLFYLHYVHPSGFSSRNALVQMESLRDLFKNRRFGSIVMESVDPFSDQEGVSIELDGPTHGWSASVSYYTDICVG